MRLPSLKPFRDAKDERIYRFHKLFAESYVTNLRNLEAPWKPVEGLARGKEGERPLVPTHRNRTQGECPRHLKKEEWQKGSLYNWHGRISAKKYRSIK